MLAQLLIVIGKVIRDACRIAYPSPFRYSRTTVQLAIPVLSLKPPYHYYAGIPVVSTHRRSMIQLEYLPPLVRNQSSCATYNCIALFVIWAPDSYLFGSMLHFGHLIVAVETY
jgi:hypothetical protein